MLIGICLKSNGGKVTLTEYNLPIVKQTEKQVVVEPCKGWYGTHYRTAQIDVIKSEWGTLSGSGYVKLEAVTHVEKVTELKKRMVSMALEKVTEDKLRAEKALEGISSLKL